MIATLVVLALLLSVPHLLAACPVDPAAYREHLKKANESFLDPDGAKFTLRFEAVEEELGCVTGRLTPDTAALTHLAWALHSRGEGDATAMYASFRGLHAADPDFVLDPELAPPGSRQRTSFDAARTGLGEGPAETVLLGDGATLIVDGRAGVSLIPTERAAVVQVETNGELRTWYLRGTGIPDDLAALFVEPQQPRRGLVIGGLATAGLGAAALIANVVMTVQYHGDGADVALRNSLQAPMQATFVAGVGLSTVGVALGATALVVGRW